MDIIDAGSRTEKEMANMLDNLRAKGFCSRSPEATMIENTVGWIDYITGAKEKRNQGSVVAEGHLQQPGNHR